MKKNYFLAKQLGKNSLNTNKSKAPESSISATLKTGKFPREIKSLTHEKKSLSKRFPKVPATKSPNSRFVKMFFLYSAMINPIQRSEKMIITIIGILIHREIPVLKTGERKGRSLPHANV